MWERRVLRPMELGELFNEAFETTQVRVWIDLALLAFFGGAVLLLKP